MIKKLCNVVLGLLLAFVSMAPTHLLKVAAQENHEEQVLTIPVSKTTGETNKFYFAENQWDGLNDPIHRWSKKPDDHHPQQTYYEVKFRGHKIDVYAGGNHPMGEIQYFIDGEPKQTFDLYLPKNTSERKVVTFDGLSEDQEHTLKAVATGKKTKGSNNLIDAGKVVVYHKPYLVNQATITNESVELVEGAESQIHITNINPSYATKADFSFTSTDKTIADVSKDGVITAHNTGNTTITVKAKNGTFTKEIRVQIKESIPNLKASIVDTDTQYTQKRFEEVKKLGLTSKTLTAWKNDKAVSEIVIASDGTILKDVNIETSELVNGSNVISADHVKATYIKSTKAYNGKFLGYGSKTREVPAETAQNRSESSDILYQDARTKMDIGVNKVQPIWVEFHIPSNAKPGNYTTTLTLNAKGLTKPITFTYTIKVQDATLPDASTFKDTFDIELWQYPYSIAEYYDVEPFSKDHFEILKPHMELYKSIGGHAITTTINEDAWAGQTYSNKGANGIHYPSMIKWEMKNGEMTYDYTNFDKWINFNKSLGIGDKIVIYSVAPWHNSFTYWKDNQLITESYLNNNGTYKDNYIPRWTHFLNDLIKHLESRGWFDESYIGIDERGFSKQAFDLIDSVTSSTAKPLKTAGAMDHFTNKYDLALRVTDLNVGDSAAAASPAKFTQLVKDREAKGYRTTLYSCTEHLPGNFSLSAPVESYWSIINAGEETSGFLRWAYDAWVEDPLNDATHNAFEPGDCFLVYPGNKIKKNQERALKEIPQPRSSIRLEKMAEGVRDVNKLKLIAKEVPTLEAEIDKIYDAMQFQAISVRNGRYLSDAELKKVIADASMFKKSIEALTEKYLDYKEHADKNVKSVEITSKISDLDFLTSMQLNAKVLPEKVIDNRLKWESNKPKIVSVDEDGYITAHRVGVATITVTSIKDGTMKDAITIHVTVPEIPKEAQHSYYSFDHNNANDEWEANRDGISASNVAYKKGKSGNALYIAKENSKGSISFQDQLSLNSTGDWTISYWVKADDIRNGKVSVLSDNQNGNAFALRIDEKERRGGLRVGPNTPDKLTFDYTFYKDNWYHVTWTHDKTQGISMFVNGNQIGKPNKWTVNNANKFKIPFDKIGGEGFTGYIDELKIYKRVLSQVEINANMLTKGLNLAETNKKLYIGETYDIDTNLISDQADKTIIYESNQPNVASVDQEGRVTAHARGTAKISVKNVASGYTETVTIKVEKKLMLQNKLPKYQLNPKHLTDIERSPYQGTGQNRQYLGQPDMIRTKTGRLITAYPIGHGHGELVMQISDDDGTTWKMKKDLPDSWKYSQETPTIYKLQLENGKERLMLITACPGWGVDQAGNRYGWNTSYSDDNGETWTEYKHWYSTFKNGKDNPVVVGMASLIQLKDDQGNDIPKWMGVYHEQTGFVNYKTYLTFDQNGKEQWSEPEPYLSEHREIEARNQMCEIGMFRSPDGKRILGLARSQSHKNLSTLIYSDDEGESWSEPMDMQGALAGERHKATYDPISDRLVITFREIRYDLNGNDKFDNDWRAGDWVAWVGSYEDLLEQNAGDYMMTLSKDYSKNTFGGDTGYAGVVVLDDGTFIMDSYGHWDDQFSSSWIDPKTNQYNIKTDLCYIRQAKFKLSDLENEYQLVNYDALEKYVLNVKNVNADDYTKESYQRYKMSFDAANQVVKEKKSQQVEVNKALKHLTKAYHALELKQDSNSSIVPENGNETNNDTDHKTNPATGVLVPVTLLWEIFFLTGIILFIVLSIRKIHLR